MGVQYCRALVELLLAPGHFRGIRLALARELLDQPLEREDRTGGKPVCGLPRMPAQHVRLIPGVGGPQSALGLLRREIVQDRVRLPQHEAVVLQHGHPLVGVEPGELRPVLLALEQVDETQVAVEAEMIGQGDHLGGSWRRGKHV